MKRFGMILISAFFMFFLIPAESFAVCSDKDGSSRSKPAWADGRRNVIDELDNMAFIGVSMPMAVETAALEYAKQNALAEIGKYLGVTIESVFLIEESEVNEKVDYRIFSKSVSTSKKVKIRKSRMADSYTECDGRNYVSYVKLVVPKSELTRTRIESDALGVWAIKSDIPQCGEKIRDIFPVFRKYGVNIGDRIEYSNRTPRQIFNEYEKMFYFKVECREIKHEEHPAGDFSVFFSQIEVSAELFNLLTGETVNRWTGKSGTVSSEKRDATLEKGAEKAVKDILRQIVAK